MSREYPLEITGKNGKRGCGAKGKPSTASATFNITVIYDGATRVLRVRAEGRLKAEGC
jgi:hypothetical protein